MSETVRITVGTSSGDIIGKDNRALQAAVDYVAGLGGGTVVVGPGEYTMYDALRLKSGITLQGAGAETILKMAPGFTSLLSTDADYGDIEVEVQDASGFTPGRGISIGYPPRPDGWHTSVATVLRRDGNRVVISRPFVYDHTLSKAAFAQTSFPIISVSEAESVTISDLAVDGNRAENGYLGGCVAAGIYLYRSHGAKILRCHVRNYNGDGISWQLCDDALLANCTSTGNASKGYHPGSGSQRPVIRNCKAFGNDEIGLFLCWRVRHGLIEGGEFSQNGVTGISIGHKDTDNLFRNNQVNRNGTYGIQFRQEPEPLAGHRNRFEANAIAENGKYGVYVGGETHDLTFTGNRVIGNPEAFFLGPGAKNVSVE